MSNNVDIRLPASNPQSIRESQPSWMRFFQKQTPSAASQVTNIPQSNSIPRGASYMEIDIENAASPPAGASDDHYLAWFMQRMEFEIPYETEEERHEREISGEFEGKEIAASKCKRQMMTLSTFIVFVDIILFWVMCAKNEIDPDNKMYGPSGLVLIEWGAKESSLIVYRSQWWRMFSPIIMHAGIVHLLSNMIIQLRVGGYLNIVYGNVRWATIYLLSGVFGNLCSCMFLPDGVSVGASGAILGMLSSWCVWIGFRWKKIPEQCHSQRNCQMTMVVICIVITLAMSFASFVDWAAHLGGTVMGVALGLVLFAHELDDLRTRFIVRALGISITVVIFAISIWYVSAKLHPSMLYLPYYDATGISKAPTAKN